jgi:hypothetical protein
MAMSKDALGVNGGREGQIQRALRPHPDRRTSRLPGQLEARVPRWHRSYRRAAIVLDMIAVAVSSALYSQWGTADDQVVLAMGATVLVLTAGALCVARAWDPRVLGHGSAEFSRLLRGFLGAAVVVALVSLASQLPAGLRDERGDSVQAPRWRRSSQSAPRTLSPRSSRRPAAPHTKAGRSLAPAPRRGVEKAAVRSWPRCR